MGLDMYLYTQKQREDSDRYDGPCLFESGLGYWRKANHIHRWFVEQVQGGKDECEEHEVLREQLMRLATTCRNVLENPTMAESLLPTMAGYFFGSTEYDDYYLEKCKETIGITEKALAAIDSGERVFYCSSW